MCTNPASHPATAHGSSRQVREHEDERECRKAAKARDAACAAIIAAPMPGAREELHRLALALLDSGGGHADSMKLAYRWAAAAGAVPARLDHYQARDQLTAPSSRDRAALLRYAYAYALATDEMHTRSRWGEWDARRAAHLDRLQTLAGYQPTEWEQQRLAEVQACADATDAQLPCTTCGCTGRTGQLRPGERDCAIRYDRDHSRPGRECSWTCAQHKDHR